MTMLAFQLLTTLILLLARQAHTQSEQQSCGPPPTAASIEYDWELQDYYQMLDLPATDQDSSRSKRMGVREVIDSQQIRRAYRKQAQIHHPDKVKIKNSTATVEESNARFGRISEAYEVLNDPGKRYDYDLWLLNCEDRNRGRAESEASSWKVFESFSDPRRVFEDFFFNAERDEPLHMQRRQGRQPVRVEETQEVLYDPYTGQEVLRVYRTEEFASNGKGKYPYRVTAQDFVETYDRFYGREYQPISSPAVVEEGYREEADHLRDTRERKDSLAGSEFMTLHSQPLKSENGKFYAGLSPGCDLIIVSDTSDSAHDEDSVIWSAGAFVPPTAGECFLSLQGPYLVVALGTPDQPGQILWNSQFAETASSEQNDEVPDVYFARLDDDGSLVVYSQKTVPYTPDINDEDQFMTNPATKTRASRAWRGVKRWTKRRLLKKEKEEHSNPDSDSPAFITRNICVFATGPAGCNVPGRKFLQFAHGVRKSVKRSMAKIDKTIDSLMEIVLDDEDEDILDTITRIAGKAGSSVARAGSVFARKGAKMIQKRFGS